MELSRKKLLYIRFSYWLGAILDALVFIEMILYMFLDFQVSLGYPNVSDETRIVLVPGATLMLGWTFLLIWGDRKPIERKTILLLTAIPVILLFIFFDLLFYGLGKIFSSILEVIAMVIIRGVIFIIFMSSYFLARNLEKEGKS